jgi:hypothetical protein
MVGDLERFVIAVFRRSGRPAADARIPDPFPQLALGPYED